MTLFEFNEDYTIWKADDGKKCLHFYPRSWELSMDAFLSVICKHGPFNYISEYTFERLGWK